MPWRRRRDRPCRQRPRAACLQASTPRAQGLRKPEGSRIEASLDLGRGAVGRTLVVDPADLQVIALLSPLEGELDVGVLGNTAAPVGREHVLAVILEGQLLDEMRRNDLALGV